MKPIKLTMTAFGPYRSQEIVNFEELEDHRLFVISGKTGAGKTTIFDGICFALYGSASGEDRQDDKMLRSHFADDDLHTSVELIFELKGKKYRVLRQLGHVKQGNKSITGEKYEFYRIEEKGEVPCVDRQIKSEIDQKLKQLLGLTKDQFSQIVMLPQGEFRKLLTSKTENKEELLRRIFQTYPYQEISERLKTKKKEAEGAFESLKQERDRYVQDIYAKLPVREDSLLFQVLEQEHFNMNQIVEGLIAEGEFYKEKIVQMDKEKNSASEKSKKMQEAYHAAKALNEKFTELEELEKKLFILNEQKDEIKAKEEQLEKAEQASHISVLETNVNEWRDDVKAKKLVQQETKVDMEDASSKLKFAEEKYMNEKNRKEEREKLSHRISQLEELLPKVKELNTKKQESNRLNQQVENLQQQLNQTKDETKSQQKAKEKLSIQVKEYSLAVDMLPEEEKKLLDMYEQAKALDKYIEVKNNLDNLINEYKESEKKYKQIKHIYEQKEEAWIQGQAGLLAKHLHNGEACPVCGSENHPNKATVAEHTPTKEELDQVKRQYEDVHKEFSQIVADGKSARGRLQECEDELNNLGIELNNVNQTFDDIRQEGKKQKQLVKELKEKKAKLQELQKSYEQVEKELNELQNKQDNLQKEYYKADSLYKSAKAVYDETLKSIPEEVREINVLEVKINETKHLKISMDQAWEKAQKEVEEYREVYTKVKANEENVSKQLAESESKLSKAETQFTAALKEAGFESEQLYQQAKRTESERKQLKENLEKYKEALLTTRNRINQLKEQLTEQEKIDLASYELQMQEAEQAYEQTLRIYNSTVQQAQDVQDIKCQIEKASTKVEHQEKQLNQIADLYDVIRGHNDLKISFERYLQIEYLEQIIEAANERLKRLSNGQFYLKRSNRQESHGKQSGLGLDVYDVYTGQDRDVKSLSGGEKFNASLCLALGMSDVIQSFQGGVVIDTMFIDEGFGSLDDESLNKAVDTLIDLQKSGRMIGVISHVQELKSSIPAILQVEKTKEGYSQTEFLIK
ncbi:AAA family ATPase [Bacillaceae bacterium W0354]